MNQSKAAQESMEASGILPSILTDESMKDLLEWLATYDVKLDQRQLFCVLLEEEARARAHNNK